MKKFLIAFLVVMYAGAAQAYVVDSNDPDLSPSEQQVAAALTELATSSGAIWTAIGPAILAMSDEQVDDLVDTVNSGNIVGGTSSGVQTGGTAHAGGQQKRTSYLRSQGPVGTAGPAATSGSGWAAWGTGLFNWVDQDNLDKRLGYDSDTQGIIAGVDKQIDRWLIGVSVGYTDTDVDVNDIKAESDVDAWQFGLYGSYSTAVWYVDAGVTYSASDIESDRTIPVFNVKVKGDTDADTMSYFLAAGYSFDWGGGLTMTPNAAINYTFSDIDGYTESGSAIWAQQINDYDVDSFTSTLGVTASYAITERFNAELRASWTHDFIDEDPKVKARWANVANSPYREFKGLRADEDSFVVGLGLNGSITDTISAYFNYDFETKDEYHAHTLTTGLRVEF